MIEDLLPFKFKLSPFDDVLIEQFGGIGKRQCLPAPPVQGNPSFPDPR
jgi:hypothetical protein